MGISMLKRKVDTLLQSWKEKPDHKALILQGARQVGKTYSVREFGKENYAEYVEIRLLGIRKQSGSIDHASSDIIVEPVRQIQKGCC